MDLGVSNFHSTVFCKTLNSECNLFEYNDVSHISEEERFHWDSVMIQ